MYAKLVIGSSLVNPIYMCRDIGRLITSATPSTSLLGAFSTTSSIVYDATPAGWTYVGSNHAEDQPSIAATNTVSVGDALYWNFCFSAPCLSGSALKYCVLAPYNYNTAANSGGTGVGDNGIILQGAAAASALGVLTNPTPRCYANGYQAGFAASTYATQSCFLNSVARIFYLIANERHITLISENTGLAAVWESSMTNAHTFYGTAPFVTMNHYGTASTMTSVTTTQAAVSASSNSLNVVAHACNVTDPNTGTNNGTYDIGTNIMTDVSLAQLTGSRRTNTIDASGNPKYVVSPIYYDMSKIGYPTQYVTGIVPIYYTKTDMGNTGDSVDVSGDTYNFFNVSSRYGVIMKTV